MCGQVGDHPGGTQRSERGDIRVDRISEKGIGDGGGRRGRDVSGRPGVLCLLCRPFPILRLYAAASHALV
eukprot:3622556-Rhodomonas_salina.3